MKPIYEAMELTVVGMRHNSLAATYHKWIYEKSKPAADKITVHVAPNKNACTGYALEVHYEGTRIGFVKDEQVATVFTRYPSLKSLPTNEAIEVNLVHSVRQYYFKIEVSESTFKKKVHMVQYLSTRPSQEYQNIWAPDPSAGQDFTTAHNPCSEIYLAGGSTTSDSSIAKDFVNTYQTKKEKGTMNNIVNNIASRNANLATSAAFMEAGRIANKQVGKVVGSKAPLMVRGYVDTAVGRLILANVASMAAAHFRGDDKRLRRLTDAMTVVAWQELYQTIDIEGFIDELVDNKSIKAALNSLDNASSADES